MEKAQGITSAYTPRMTEDDLSPSVSPPSLWRLMGQTRRALWALRHQDPDKAAAILRRQLEDFRQTLDAASPPEAAPEQRPNPRAKSDAFLQARWPRKLTDEEHRAYVLLSIEEGSLGTGGGVTDCLVHQFQKERKQTAEGPQDPPAA